ncbi:hypothetical protein LTR56_011683 [Elasticomyces elasticus]|nr:hypothetical protein LTR56_011683 [Elasticomyces elasticus]KAK3658530.1 hypothetical protein LTR22_008883 [Elasticomyces elasticus]KAK4921178.1 hypothetical protein LTR49_011365 [Elasticomyces elasticus]KAK5761895.1 hypothetical protein LTS12_007958 [Elasticomyces elasticus]
MPSPSVEFATDHEGPSVATNQQVDESGSREELSDARMRSSGAEAGYSPQSHEEMPYSTGTELSDPCLDDATPSDVANLLEEYDEKQNDPNPTMDESEEEDGDEPAITALDLLEEVRDEGYSHDTLLEDPLRSVWMPTPPASADGDLEEWPEVESGHRTAATNLAGHGEKWEVDKETIGFLASVMALGREDEQVTVLDDTPLTFTDLKIDETVLQCDAAVEVRKLRERHVVKLTPHGLEPFALDTEKGESIQWPSTDLALPSKIHEQIVADRLQISRDEAAYLQNIVQPSVMSFAEMIGSSIGSDKPWRMEPQTPPLLPLSPPYSPPAPPAELLELPLTSTPGNLIAIEAAEVQRAIMQADDDSASAGMCSGETISEPYSFIQTSGDSSTLSEKPKRFEDMKADVPLLPTSATWQSSPVKSRGFPTEIRSLIPLPDSDMSILDPRVADQDVGDFVNEPGIKRSLIDLQRGLMSFTKREIIKSETSWSGVSKLERTMGWTPFATRLGKVKTEEVFDDDGSSARYMADLVMDGDLDIGGLISKAEGLRILDGHESDDDEIEPAKFEFEEVDDHQTSAITEHETSHAQPSPKVATEAEHTKPAVPTLVAEPPRIDMQTLLRKRKQELESTTTIGHAMNTGLDPSSKNVMKKPRLQDAGLTSLAESGSLFTAGGIASFMQLQGNKSSTHARDEERINAQTQPAAPPAVMVQPVQEAKRIDVHVPLPCPRLSDQNQALQIVVSTKVLTDRVLVKQLNALLPGLEMIERVHVPQAARGSNTLSENVASMDADMTISPAAGLLTTTLQKLNQKPLPGQANFYGVREHVANVAVRYEKLIVLVAQSQQLAGEEGTEIRNLTERDCDALSDFMAFTATLDADIEVRLLPGGSPDIAKWIAATISHHASSIRNDMQLLSDETLWERFLRTAGLNAFAAQVILAQLKPPEEAIRNGSSSVIQSFQGDVCGLAAFVRMSLTQRLQQFGPLLGGERMLRRVSEVVDVGWKSVAPGPW